MDHVVRVVVTSSILTLVPQRTLLKALFTATLQGNYAHLALRRFLQSKLVEGTRGEVIFKISRKSMN